MAIWHFFHCRKCSTRSSRHLSLTGITVDLPKSVVYHDFAKATK